MPEDPQHDATSTRSFFKRYRAKVAMLSVGVAVVAGIVAFNEVTGTAEPRTVDVKAAAPPVQVDFNRPFLGTPAADWSDGAEGIVAPPAQAVGPFNAQQVKDAYAQVRQVLITSRLDRAVLEQHDVERYLKLLAKDSQRKMRPVFADEPHEAHAYATRLATGFRLLPAEPKVRGRMWAEQGNKPGELVVHTNYVFAYAFDTSEPDRLRNAMDIVAVGRWDVDYSVLGDKYAATSRGVWASRSHGFTYSMGCDALQAGYLAPAYSQRRDGEGSDQSEDRTAYFDPSADLPSQTTCG
ncbi:hypothetical protein LWC34_53285 [Kibdelosporangium philippinense]|uniref:Uncharacterized protein n=1 Tax=Kibdelosporangium philippinense TaxID=211113 RepID=A0ABS8ZXP9_9PSEU|nr:hypothetical protein [Kibdelosporangium philippinense]MCE7011531.1 hypothetical protein [Kibdelosporangium philippinense]